MNVNTPGTQIVTDNHFAPVVWSGSHLDILDQRRLPKEAIWIQASRSADVALAIREMAVRGAPAIGIAAAWGVLLAAREFSPGKDATAFDTALQELANARPTAVNLHWALQRMRAVVERAPADLDTALEREARTIQREDLEMNRSMAALGAALLMPGSRLFTQCTTGALATGGIGTALGVIIQAHTEGRVASVCATETRPWMQGARLTAWELSQAGIAATLITEGAAASKMQRDGIDWLIVGADRVTANGDVANKIGTYGLAVLARAHGGNVMVVAPSSTVDMTLESGAEIPIESRPAQEVLAAAGIGEAPPGISVANPAFDVTPASYVDCLVTDRGVVENPSVERMRALLGNSR